MINDRVYLFCGHNQSSLIENYCRMDKWYILSSDNLQDWKIEGEINPRDTYMTQYDCCWAGDIAKKGDKSTLFKSGLKPKTCNSKNNYNPAEAQKQKMDN